MNYSTPLVFLHLLADLKFQPRAVFFSCAVPASDAANGVASVCSSEDISAYATFAADFPCYIAARESAHPLKCLPPELWQGLQDAGGLILAEAALYRCDALLKPEPPASAQWILGEWYLAPPPKAVGSQAVSRTTALRLLQLVTSDAETRQIEDVFRQDPLLSYHLLRLVNSLGVATGKRVTSFAQAILILGRQQLRRWLNLMLFAARKDDYRAAMLLARVSVRARSMELLAKATGLDRTMQEQAFMGGMFSMLGVLFGTPLVDILKPLPLSEVLVEAVLRHAGPLGGLLQMVEAAERGDEPGVQNGLTQVFLPVAEFNRINLEAHHWMLGVILDRHENV